MTFRTAFLHVTPIFTTPTAQQNTTCSRNLKYMTMPADDVIMIIGVTSLYLLMMKQHLILGVI